MDEGGQSQVHDLLYGSKHLFHFFHGGGCKGYPLAAKLLGGFQNIHGVVADALEIADHVQQLRRLHPILLVEMAAGELHQVGAQLVLIAVGGLLIVPNALGAPILVGLQLLHGIAGGTDSRKPHFHGHLMAALHGHGGRSHEPLVQLRHAVAAGVVGDNATGQLFQQTRHGQQQRRAEDIEDGVHDGNAHLVDAAAQHWDIHKAAHHLKHCQPHHGADDIEGEMHRRGAAGVAVGADGRQQRRDAGADVLPHDDGNGGAEGDLTGGGHRLQNTHRGGGGLDDRREHSAGHHTEDGVGEHQQQFAEALHVLQTRHGAAHGVHAEHQCGKAQKNKPRILLLAALAHHIQRNAHKCQDRRERRGLEELHKEIIALDARQAQDPRRHRGAHVGSHDDVDGLPQRHKPRVYKAHHHDRCGGGRLDHRRDAHAGEEACGLAAGELAQ